MKKEVYLAIGIGGLAFAFSLLLDQFIVSIVPDLKNNYLTSIFSWVTNFINVFTILIIITTLFLIEEKKKEWILPLWLSFSFATIVSYVLKEIVARPRPTAEIFSQVFTSLNYSFPSLHAMVSFSVLPILIREFPRLKWAWILFSVSVAVSRIYFEYHYLSDVVFGAAVGYLIGVFAVTLELKYKPFRFMQK